MESFDILNSYSAKNFESWLIKQLGQVYCGSPEEKYRAFDFRHLGVSRGESHTDALQGLFEKLSDNAKEQFREALGRILQHAKLEHFPKEAMADIVTLTGLTDAYDVFTTFVPVLGNGYWGEMQPFLIYDALSVLMMFDRSEEAYRSAKGLATSIHFPNALVFDAYLVMVRSRPQNWGEDFVLLQDRFSKIIEQVNSSADAKMFEQLYRRQFGLAKSLSEAVPMSELGLQLPVLSYADKWLSDFLFEKILCLQGGNDIDGIQIVDRDNPLRKATLETTSAFEIISLSEGWFYTPLHSELSLKNTPLSEKTLARYKNTRGINSHNQFSLVTQETAYEN